MFPAILRYDSHMSFVDSNADVHCPRCGYNQRGAMATWDEKGSCPLKGTCAECGLTFLWIEMFEPERVPPRWCIEHTDASRFPIAMFMTCFHSLRPWRFWSRLKMSHEVCRRRLVCYVAVFFCALVLLFSCVQATAAYFVRKSIDNDLAAQLTHAQMIVAGPQPATELNEDEQALIRLAYPDEYEVRLDFERRRIEREGRIFSHAHLTVENPRQVKQSVWWCVAEGVLLPLASESRMRIKEHSGESRYPIAPRKLVSYAVDHYRWSGGRNALIAWRARTFTDLLETLRLPLLIGLALPIIFPATLALLPLSRRRAKVRWTHIWRIYAYGVAHPVLAVFVVVGLVVWDALIPNRGTPGLIAFVLLTFGLPLFVFAWWAASLGRYLQLPHAAVVAFIHSAMSVLLVLAVIWLIFPSWIIPGPGG